MLLVSTPTRPRTTAVLAAAAAASLLAGPGIAAGDPNVCVAARAKCTAKGVQARFQCYAKAVRRGLDPATNPRIHACLQRADDWFDGAADPSGGCFDRAAARENPAKPQTLCPAADAAAVNAKAVSFVADVMTDIAPGLTPAPRFQDTGLTIIDHATGLEWEKKTTDGGVHDVGRFYRLSDSSDGDLTDPDGDAFTEFLAALNACTTSDGSTVGGGFAGRCDWRIPQVDELATLLDTSVPGCGTGVACIDPIFGPTAADGHWSATSITGNPNAARGVNFEQGSIGFGDKDDALVVRAVRGGS